MVGKFIILRRKKLGISRKELAEKLNITYSYLNLIETDKRKISKKLLPKIAKELKVKEKELDLYNEYKYGAEKKSMKKRIETINKKLAKIEVNKLLLEKERDYLVKKINKVIIKEKEHKGVLSGNGK